MRLRLILFILCMLAFLSVSSSGYLYYSALKKAEIQEAETQAGIRTETIRKTLSSFLSENLKPARLLAGMKEIRQALVSPSADAPAQANSIADRFKDTLNADVCYVINQQGTTIASSNREAEDSFLGLNFAFRPYFQQALKGYSSIYLALGTASGKRGAYTAYPVYETNTDKPVGTAVIKASVESVEKELSLSSDETVLVADPSGIIFISSRKDWLYHSLRKLSDEEIKTISDSLQFGKGPWDWTGLRIEGRYAADASNNQYVVHTLEMNDYPGWSVLYLQNLSAVFKRASNLVIKGIVLLCMLVGISLFILYRRASNEILRRKQIEAALKRAKEELSRYSKDLECRIRKRNEEIVSILKYTPDIVYIRDIDGRYLMVNPKYEEMLGVKNEDIRGKTMHEVLPKEQAEEFESSDKIVFSEKRPIQVENTVPYKEEKRIYLSVKFPIYDESGNIGGIGGISTDITELKKAQEQLRRVSESIIAGQEKERTAIARELHDELGQMLTALRMEAVWIKKRLSESDPKTAERSEAMCGMIDKTIADVRGIAIRLRPGVLDTLGLADALEWYTTDFERRTGIACIFTRSQIPEIEDRLATAAYRIAQESLTNVARHAESSKAEVALTSDKGFVVLTISDDGCGFEISELNKNKGLGLAGMRERAGLAGGTLDICSLPGKGARVSFRFRITEKQYDKTSSC